MEPKRQVDDVSSYIVDGWKNYVPVLPAFGPGRQEFKLVYEDGRLMESTELPASATQQLGDPGGRDSSVTTPGWLTMLQAAAKCRCSLTWFSRNWKGWGLHPSRLGRLLFDEQEIETLLKGKRISRRGRPPKVRGQRA